MGMLIKIGHKKFGEMCFLIGHFHKNITVTTNNFPSITTTSTTDCISYQYECVRVDPNETFG